MQYGFTDDEFRAANLPLPEEQLEDSSWVMTPRDAEWMDQEDIDRETEYRYLHQYDDLPGEREYHVENRKLRTELRKAIKQYLKFVRKREKFRFNYLQDRGDDRSLGHGGHSGDVDRDGVEALEASMEHLKGYDQKYEYLLATSPREEHYATGNSDNR